jgi:hypothetical protein
MIEAKIVDLVVSWVKTGLSAANTRSQQRLANVAGISGMVVACL